MHTGISLYPGLDGTPEDHLSLLKQAADLGIHRLFTSFHIPEANTNVLRQELHTLLAAARSYNMDVIADISPQTTALLGIDIQQPQTLLNLGITTARLDYGFSIEKTALFSRIMPIQLNASTLRSSDIQALQDASADFSHIDCLHNFYPRPHTGLSPAYVLQQTRWLQENGLSVGAFIASQSGRRGPLYEGLPTLEMHRTLNVSLASRHLAAMGMQSVFIGDSQPTTNELESLAHTGWDEKNVVVLKARLVSRKPIIRDLLSYTFTARLDAAQDVIRTQESRSHIGSHIITADGPQCPLQYGDITIDNQGFQRYMGEIQLIQRSLPAEPRTNIAARILPEEQFLLSYITPGRKFRFEWVR